MKFLVLSRAEVESLAPITDCNHAFISVRTPGDPDQVKLPWSDKTKASYHLNFYDIDLPAKDAPEDYFREIFDAHMASMLLECVEKWHKTFDLELIVIHCDAGISRSPAIAAGLCRTIFGQDDSPFFEQFHPNRRVYRALIDAYAFSKVMEQDAAKHLTECMAVERVLALGYEVSLYSVLMARPLEYGRFACEVRNLNPSSSEVIVDSASEAAAWLVTRRHVDKLGPEYEP